MRTFNVHEYDEDRILLKSADDLSDMYALIKEEENFIVDDGDQGKLVIAARIAADVENEDFELSYE